MRMINAAFAVGRGKPASLAMVKALHRPRLSRVEATRCRSASILRATYANNISECLSNNMLAEPHRVLSIAVDRVHVGRNVLCSAASFQM